MHVLTIGSFVFFTGLVGLVTWILTRKDDHGSAQGYFLAGRTLTGGYIAGSLVLTNLSTEQLVGLNGAAYGDGICVMAWEVIAALALVVMSLLFLPRYLKSGITTIPQFLEQRFDSQTRTLTSAIFIVAYAGILLPIILYTGATAMMDILNIQQLTGIESRQQILMMMVWMIGILGSVYAIFGGLRTVAVSDSLNGLGLLVGGVMISLFGLHAVSDQGIFAALQELVQAHPEKFNSIGGPKQSVPFSTLFTGVVLLNLSYWCTNQQIIQRALGARNLAEGQKGVLIAGVFKVMVPLILILPGIIAFHLYHDQGIRADHAYGTLVQQVLPEPLAGFFAAVMVGAILSSYNSVLNSTATLFSLGIYKNVLRPEASETQIINTGKRFGVVIAISAMLAAPMLAGQDSIFAYLQKMNGLYLIPIFAVVLVGLLTRRVPAFAAKLALILGCLGTALGYIVLEQVKQTGNKYEEYAKYYEFHFLGEVFVSMIGFMLILGWLFPKKTGWKLVDSKEVDLTPWKAAWPLATVLVLTVLSLYVGFAK